MIAVEARPLPVHSLGYQPALDGDHLSDNRW
jgi:hypothetical protein